PLPLFEDVGVCLLDQSADPAERLAAPVVELGDSLADPLRGGLAFLRGPGAFHRCLVGMIRTYPIRRLEGNSGRLTIPFGDDAILREDKRRRTSLAPPECRRFYPEQWRTREPGPRAVAPPPAREGSHGRRLARGVARPAPGARERRLRGPLRALLQGGLRHPAAPVPAHAANRASQ